jgi:hypothetical protein
MGQHVSCNATIPKNDRGISSFTYSGHSESEDNTKLKLNFTFTDPDEQNHRNSPHKLEEISKKVEKPAELAGGKLTAMQKFKKSFSRAISPIELLAPAAGSSPRQANRRNFITADSYYKRLMAQSNKPEDELNAKSSACQSNLSQFAPESSTSYHKESKFPSFDTNIFDSNHRLHPQTLILPVKASDTEPQADLTKKVTYQFPDAEENQSNQSRRERRRLHQRNSSSNPAGRQHRRGVSVVSVNNKPEYLAADEEESPEEEGGKSIFKLTPPLANQSSDFVHNSHPFSLSNRSVLSFLFAQSSTSYIPADETVPGLVYGCANVPISPIYLEKLAKSHNNGADADEVGNTAEVAANSGSFGATASHQLPELSVETAEISKTWAESSESSLAAAEMSQIFKSTLPTAQLHIAQLVEQGISKPKVNKRSSSESLSADPARFKGHYSLTTPILLPEMTKFLPPKLIKDDEHKSVVSSVPARFRFLEEENNSAGPRGAMVARAESFLSLPRLNTSSRRNTANSDLNTRLSSLLASTSSQITSSA